MATTKEVAVTVTVRVTVDETKFTPEFMAEFRDGLYDFHTLDEHILHLGQLCGRGLVDNLTEFIEGYGPPADMGIVFEWIDGTEELVA
jgi:hypothetical protein